MMMTLECWWKDEFLVFEHIPRFSNISYVNLDADSFWIPKIYLLNAVTENNYFKPKYWELGHIFKNGEVHLLMSAYSIAGCNMDPQMYA